MASIEKVSSLERENEQLKAEIAQMRQGSSANTLQLSQLQQSLLHAELLVVSTDQLGEITYCNHAFATAVGIPTRKIKGQDLFKELEPLRGDKLTIDQFIKFTKERKKLRSIKRFIRTPSGQKLTISIQSIILHQEGKQGLTIIAEDIRVQKQVQKKLQQSNRQLADLYDRAYDLIIVTDEKGKIVVVNKAFYVKLKYRSTEVEKITLFDIIAPAYQEQFRGLWNRMLAQNQSDHFQVAFVSSQGETIHVSGTLTTSLQEGVKKVRGVFHDISDQVQADQARSLYYNITNLVLQSPNLDYLYPNIYRELGKTVKTEDLIITTWREGELKFVYENSQDPARYEDKQQQATLRALCHYAITVSHPLFLHQDDILELQRSGKIPSAPIQPKIWIGIPLKIQGKLVGILVLQNFKEEGQVGVGDFELLDFVSGQIALIVERKRYEEELVDYTSRLKAIFESSTHLIWSVDEDLRFTTFNRNFEYTFRSHFGVGPIVGEVYNPLDEKTTERYLEQWREKYLEVFDGSIAHFEAKMRFGKDVIIWKSVFLNPIYREDGSVREVSGIAHDITQRRQSEQALAESEEKFRTIFESFQDIYFRCRLDGVITMISPSVHELMAYETYEVEGKDITNYYLYDKKTKNLIRQLVKNKRVRNFEATVISKSGKLIPCICNVRLVGNLSGKKTEIEGVLRDITQLKETTRALQKAKDIAEHSLKAKEAFLANMSHEIRTPMNGVISMVDMLGDTALNAEQADYVQTIKYSSETLLTILNDILDLSKIEAGKMQLHQAALPIERALEKNHSLFAQQASAKNLQFAYQIASEVPEYLWIDETRLLQILSNLTANAIKFTERGEVLIRVEGVISEDENLDTNHQRTIKVSVQDTGIGISAEDQQKLFESFNQVDPSTSKRYKGTGLGLSIARQLSSLMEGNVGVTSEPGRGSTFWFTFVAREAQAEEVQQGLDKDPIVRFTDFTPQVLVVDDNAINRKVVSEMLKKSGCNVTLAGSGKEAIEIVQQKTFDVIYMDIQMPEMDGLETTRRIRALNLPKVPPIVALTAYSLPGDKEKFMKAGMDDYLAKPIRKNIITKTAALLGIKSEGEAANEEESATTAVLELINWDTLKTLEKYGGKELVVESLQEFEMEAKELLADASAGVEKRDYQQILSKLHTLKGNAGTLGLESIAYYAKLIESNLKEENRKNLHQDFKTLKKEFVKFQNNYKQ
ncbi:MAG: PAS domain S-box protein [Bacteroidota bacterium]